jgi:hypothetical protein
MMTTTTRGAPYRIALTTGIIWTLRPCALSASLISLFCAATSISALMMFSYPTRDM